MAVEWKEMDVDDGKAAISVYQSCDEDSAILDCGGGQRPVVKQLSVGLDGINSFPSLPFAAVSRSRHRNLWNTVSICSIL